MVSAAASCKVGHVLRDPRRRYRWFQQLHREQLAMFGVTHAVAIDGFSSCIDVYKNDLTIYENVPRQEKKVHKVT